MGTILQDLKYGLRMLAKSPGFTAVAVLTLALGIGANTAVFTVLKGVLLSPLSFPQPERLLLISIEDDHGPFDNGPGLTDGRYLEFRRQNSSFENIATFGQIPITVTGGGDALRVMGSSVTPSLFSVLRVNPAMGRTFLPDEEQPGRDAVVLLSDTFWRSRFAADPNILGKTITIDGMGRKVIGVMRAGFTFPYGARLWLPLAVRNDPHSSFFRPTVGRLKAKVSPQQAQAELEAFAQHLPPSAGTNRRERLAKILPLKELLVGNIRKSLLIFAGAVGFVLLIACANVANLLLMRGASRRQEIAVRAALGARRWRLIRQLLTESMLLSLAGGAAGMLVAVWGVPALLALAPNGTIPRVEDIHIDGWVLAFMLGVAASMGILFGLAPAFQTTGHSLRDSLNQGGRGIRGGRQGLRSALVVSEIALALILLTGAGLMLKSFLRIRAVDPGFHPENVLTMTVNLPGSIYPTTTQMQAFHAQTLAKLSSLPGVVAAGAVNWLPLTETLVRGDFHLEGGRQLPPHYMVDRPCVSSEYFLAMGIRLLKGRGFTEHDSSSAPGVVVISEAVARSVWPGEDPIGKGLTLEDHPKPQDWVTVVGVVNDVRQEGLTQKAHAAIYQPYAQATRPFFLAHMTFVVRTASNSHGVAAAMRRVLHDVDKDQPVQSITPMADILATTSAVPWFHTRLISIFSMLALLLSAIGIYGVLAYSVTERTPEIAIRMALGAARSDITRMVLHRSLFLVTAGVALGVAGALAVTRVLAKFLFEVKPTDPATFVMVAMGLAIVALSAGMLPARRATRVDPLVALRHD